MNSHTHVANIGPRGADRRRRNGYVWAGIAAVAIAMLLAGGAPRSWRLLVGIPVGLAALGLLQAREKT